MTITFSIILVPSLLVIFLTRSNPSLREIVLNKKIKKSIYSLKIKDKLRDHPQLRLSYTNHPHVWVITENLSITCYKSDTTP